MNPSTEKAPAILHIAADYFNIFLLFALLSILNMPIRVIAPITIPVCKYMLLLSPVFGVGGFLGL